MPWEAGPSADLLDATDGLDRLALATPLLGATGWIDTLGRLVATPQPTGEALRDTLRDMLAPLGFGLRALPGGEGPPSLVAARRTGLAGGADPKALAAALVKVLRAPLPAPEELASPDEYLRRPVREPREPRGEEGIWFRMNVGRDGRADPRWVLPFLCRRGGVQRNEIGRIRILGRETQFEVASAAAGRFAAAARRPDADDPHIRVEPLPGGATPAQAPRPPYRDRGERSGPRRGAART